MDNSRSVAPNCLHSRPLPVVVIDDRLVGVEAVSSFSFASFSWTINLSVHTSFVFGRP